MVSRSNVLLLFVMLTLLRIEHFTTAIIFIFPQLALKVTIKDAGPDRLNVTLESPQANVVMHDGYMALGFSPTGGMVSCAYAE